MKQDKLFYYSDIHSLQVTSQDEGREPGVMIHMVLCFFPVFLPFLPVGEEADRSRGILSCSPTPLQGGRGSVCTTALSER